MIKNDFSKLIVEVIKSVVIRNVKKEYSVERDRVFVTEVVGCIRQSFYNRVFINQLEYATAFRILRGILIHEWLAEKLPVGLSEVKEREELRVEVEVNGKGKLVGRADYLIGDYVVELKTTSRRRLEKPLEEHVKQVMLYMHMLNKEKGVIIYLHDDGGISSFVVSKDEEVINRLIRKAEKLLESLKSGYPPEAEPGVYCKWCPWRREDMCEEGVTASLPA